MSAPAIKSRPVYTGLQVNLRARHNLFALEGEGALALIEQVAVVGTEFLSRSDILYVATGSQPRAHDKTLQQLGPNAFWLSPSVATLLTRLRAALANATMGTRLYVAGTEGFIGQVVQLAQDAGMDFASILTEHRGSLARRVQCVHCKGITEDVKATPFTCAHCGLKLFVRDHYSRRIAAFQGVNIDAEAPGAVPAPEELYP